MTPVLEARGLRKTFPGVVALADASLVLRRGEVHALLGENGAGKSTLMKILAGVYPPDAGTLSIDGVRAIFSCPQAARDHGIATIYQEFSLVPDLSIAENLFLGDEPLRHGLPDFATMRARACELLARLGVSIDPRTLVRELSVAEQQLVEITRSLRRQPRILTMDEPTAALSQRETMRLHALVRQLVADGLAVLYVSHRLPDVFELCRVATVLRDGTTVAQVQLEEVDEDAIIRLMVGREIVDLYPARKASARDGASKPVRLKVQGLIRGGRFSDVSLEVRAGEIVGLAGLVGAGRTEVLRCIYGADAPDAGTVLLDDARLTLGDPRASVAAGLGLLNEDRKREGLATGRSVLENTSLSVLPRFSPGGVLDHARERAEATRTTAWLRVRTPSVDANIDHLSGGNQQKVLLARWLLTGLKVLLCDEPTRGIDVGARAEIYEQLAMLAESGLAILVVSSDLPEVLGICDRIYVMAEGRITGCLPREDASEEAVLALATPRKASVRAHS